MFPGVARGSGWQHLGAYVNLGAYYLVGIPVALLLGFVWHLRGLGLWSGLVAGATVQSIMLSLITSLTNWEKQVLYMNFSSILDGEYSQKCTSLLKFLQVTKNTKMQLNLVSCVRDNHMQCIYFALLQQSSCTLRNYFRHN